MEGISTEEGTVCDPDVGVWDLPASDFKKRGDLSSEDARLLEAMSN